MKTNSLFVLSQLSDFLCRGCTTQPGGIFFSEYIIVEKTDQKYCSLHIFIVKKKG